MNSKNEICKVLVVDDEPGMTFGVAKALKKYSVLLEDNDTKVSYDVSSVLDEENFYKILEKETFDIILLDYKLPKVTGLELLEFIINKKMDTLVIMITAYATFETAVQSTKLGAYDFLAKPFSPDELRSTIQKATTHLILSRQARLFDEEKRQIRFKFISILSHELKAPLNAVEGYVDILLDRKYGSLSEEDYKRFLNRSKIRIEGMRKLIFDLLDLTRIESGEKKRILTNCNLEIIAKNSIDLFSQEAKNNNIAVDLISNKSIELLADSSELDIIFNNLISNAIKYNNDNGIVKIKLKDYDDKVCIIVSDNGIGIEKDQLAGLFEEFTRVKNDKTMHILGSGLGLSTLKKISKLYNGNIKVKSLFGKGSTFILTLYKPDQ